ncbi:lipolytic protein-like protein G-D-S-L family [Aaosphaeria arxii CBS 175.79]|uniref:Lipolytic protein-like protein G-D-S-L family n=1 Tax=Aaosphaeria arxii CBS 175.79 TaxID=1450172 RepID=A0A6A5Y9A4_9PLEO|nr:lipolytic protein-like protein G-D-S-L family [Aaosphaeria arxii CBS 175.79]KAF2022182.1 lipolytic protein-like protein G-D-S-L family [Aaosphaeria arxii CBS 175.79]
MFGVQLSLAVTLVAAALLPAAAHGRAVDAVEKRQDGFHWVNTWTSMPQLVESNNMPPSPFSSGGVLKDATLRQTLHMSVGAPKIKITISNTFGGSDLPITAGSVALTAGGAAGVSGIQESPLAAITVGGKSSFTVPRGQVVTSDEINFKVEPQSNIAVTLYSQQGQSGSSITGHPGSRTTSWFVAGNKVNATSFSGTASVHWYFVSAVQAYVPTDTGSLIILGDSITDGRGSDDNKNNRWPDLVLARLQAANYTNVAVCNQAAGGNTVLSGGLGPTLLSRYQRVNDLGNTPDSSASSVADQLIKAFTQIVSDAKKAGFKTIGGTITPFGGSSYAGNGRETARKKVNKWILESGTFDHTVDFSKAIENKSNPSQIDAKFHGGDSLHPNGAGYKAMADAFPLEIFKA